MEVKGTAVISLREFVKDKFGEDGFKRWTEYLPAESRKIFTSTILPNNWFNIKEALVEPTNRVSNMFYGGDTVKGAWESGRFSAAYSLRGIYGLFVKMGSPQFIMSKAGTILPTFYKPSVMRADPDGEYGTRVKVLEFEEYSSAVENRIGGWIQQALEVSGCNNVAVKVEKSMLRGNRETEYAIRWDPKK
jgi:hypothetical protein